MRVRVAGLGDECPGAGTKGAKGAEGEGHVVVVQILRLNDGPVVLVLLCAVLVGRETTLLCRLVDTILIRCDLATRLFAPCS